MTWFMQLMRSLNPLRAYLDYRYQCRLTEQRRHELERLDRAEERQILRQSIDAMTTVMVKSFEASAGQTAALNAILAGFQVTEAPRVREWDEEADEKRYLAKQQPSNVPPELAGLSQIEQFSALIDKLNS